MVRSLIFSSLLSSLIITSAAFSQVVTPGDMKDTISVNFIKNVNNPITQISQTIARINQETSDALNPNGTIAMPVKGTDMHLVTLNSEVLSNPWVNAVKSGQTCTTTNQNSKFLILLYSKTLTTIGSHEDKVVLTAEARLQLTRKILNNSTESCNDSAGMYSEVQTTIDTDRCQLAKVTEL